MLKGGHRPEQEPRTPSIYHEPKSCLNPQLKQGIPPQAAAAVSTCSRLAGHSIRYRCPPSNEHVSAASRACVSYSTMLVQGLGDVSPQALINHSIRPYASLDLLTLRECLAMVWNGSRAVPATVPGKHSVLGKLQEARPMVAMAEAL
ncbi:hypothetical protein VNO77_44209 [Canavalia gladiata]|uniref:Uncharacterized protein n=1 Tax=Canavalia gladiata TaxID=3824 RepID=A0AAN9JWA0_CANGL